MIKETDFKKIDLSHECYYYEYLTEYKENKISICIESVIGYILVAVYVNDSGGSLFPKIYIEVNNTNKVMQAANEQLELTIKEIDKL